MNETKKVAKKTIPVKHSKREAKDKIIALFRSHGIESEDLTYKVGSIIFETKCDCEDADSKDKVKQLQAEKADMDIRLRNAMTMFQSAKGVISQREIIIEFLMERLGVER